MKLRQDLVERADVQAAVAVLIVGPGDLRMGAVSKALAGLPAAKVDWSSVTFAEMAEAVGAMAEALKARNPIGVNAYVRRLDEAAAGLEELASAERDHPTCDDGWEEPGEGADPQAPTYEAAFAEDAKRDKRAKPATTDFDVFEGRRAFSCKRCGALVGADCLGLHGRFHEGDGR